MNEQIKLSGDLKICLNGNVVREVKNLVTTAGKVWIATLMQSGSGTAMTHMAIGTGTNAAAVGDTTLQTENARVALTVTGGSRTNAVIVYEGVYPAATGTGTITEAGILNAASGGTLLSHSVFAAVTKGAGDQLTITWTITVS